MTTTTPAKYLVFDTEGTGLFDYKQPADAEGQPRLAAITTILCDEAGGELSRQTNYVLPDGWEMTPEAEAVNGLSTDFLREHGVPVSVVLDAWEGLVNSGVAFVAYNAQHDMKQLRAEFRRAGRNDMFEMTRNTCLMRAMSPYKAEGLKLKGWMVSLKTVCEFFGIVQEQAHTSGDDAESARQILARLIADGRLPEARVHYARNPPVKAADAPEVAE